MFKPVLAFCGTTVALLLATAPAFAARTYKIDPIDLGSGYTLSGSISAAGTGPLTEANIVGWNIKVKSLQDIVYTPANTRNLSSGLIANNGQLLVPTSPGGGNDGSAMVFYGQNYFQVRPADFTGAWVKGGEALYIAGAASGFKPLGRPNRFNYVAGTATTPGSNIFSLTSRNFGNGVVLSGTVTADAVAGPVTLTDWNVLVRETQSWSFTPKNSSILSAFNLSSDARTLSVTPFDADFNAGGLQIGRFGADGFSGVYLGDFSYDPAGVVGIVTPFVYQTIAAPLDANGNFIVGRYGLPSVAVSAAAAVPDPQIWALLAAGFGLVGSTLRRTRRVSQPRVRQRLVGGMRG